MELRTPSKDGDSRKDGAHWGSAISETRRTKSHSANLNITYITTPSDQQSAGGPTYVAFLLASAWIASGGR